MISEQTKQSDTLCPIHWLSKGFSGLHWITEFNSHSLGALIIRMALWCISLIRNPPTNSIGIVKALILLGCWCFGVVFCFVKFAGYSRHALQLRTQNKGFSRSLFRNHRSTVRVLEGLGFSKFRASSLGRFCCSLYRIVDSHWHRTFTWILPPGRFSGPQAWLRVWSCVETSRWHRSVSGLSRSDQVGIVHPRFKSWRQLRA